MKTDDIRQSFLDFFASKDHKVITSDSLVPHDDPTLLFTGAGMNQFKEYFLGLKKDLKRATSSQKCLRTGDLDNVGKTAYHHSFFEMLGNFSFGDYFKEEAIGWAWEYLTQELKIPAERLRISIHHTDQEAHKIWRDKIKVREDWIYPMGDESNFWPANAPKEGPNGPCGPCSEIYFDLGSEAAPDASQSDITSRRFAEIWNLVFTQFNRQEEGDLAPLKNKNIDTGMGLERLACVMQGKKSNYEIDIFQPVLDVVQRVLKIAMNSSNKKTVYAIADHARAALFAMADGVIPSNEGRGYVIRKLIRRSLWQAHQAVDFGLEDPFLYQLVPAIVKVMSRGFPLLQDAAKSVEATLKGEEERFLDTLETGLGILSQRLRGFKSSTAQVLPSELVFELYDTYGFPDELTRAIAEEQGFGVDQKGFDALMEKQRERAKQSSQISGSIFVSSDLEKKLLSLNPTKFLGYQTLSAEGTVLLAELSTNEGVIVLDQTPFYAESGGQVGDQGILECRSFKARVVDTQKKDKVFLHHVEFEGGAVEAGMKISASVDACRRQRIIRNHTATHLLHAALRSLLGEQVRQLGSLVAPDRLRFDYSYSQALTEDQIKRIEDAVNQEILKSTLVVKEEKSMDEARKEGAMAFFGEKYSSVVRVVTVPGFSKELCGGTHCEGTGQIGAFLITSESSVASGTRRIEAVTGEGALEYLQKMRAELTGLAQELKTSPAQLSERVKKLKASLKDLEKMRAQGAAVAADPREILKGAAKAGALRFAAYHEKNLAIPDLRHLSDVLSSSGAVTVYFLGTENDDKINFLLGMSQDLKKTGLDLRELMKELSPLLGANSGGRKDLVQGGCKNEKQFQEKWQGIIRCAQSYLESRGGVTPPV